MPIGKGMKSAGARLAESGEVKFAVLTRDYKVAGRMLARQGERVRLIDEIMPGEIVWVYRESKSYATGIPGWLLAPAPPAASPE